MKNLAIIPARSGSQRLKHKNIKLLDDKPLIAYTIETAIQSNIFDDVIVSTDSQEYADIAIKYGATVPFLRDANLSTSTASSWDAVRDAFYNYNKQEFDTIALLQPTSPLRTPEDIKNAYNILIQKNANSVVSVCKCHSPYLINTLDKNLSLNNFININNMQKLDDYYKLNGAIYICQTKILDKIESEIYGDKSFAYVMSVQNSIDIDTEFDFEIANLIIKSKFK